MSAGTASTGRKGKPMDKAECIALAVHLGDEGAVERLIRAYQDQLYGYALRMVRNPFDAEEVTQDAFIRACRTLALSYGPERCRQLDLRPWLFRITRNLALNRIRARRSAEKDRLSAVDSPISAHTVQDAKTGQPLERLADQDTVRRALDTLELESRELVVLRFIEGLSYAEIAKATGGTAAAARGKVFRALRRLRTLLTGGGSPCDAKQ
jgi:RNA polymerase sigma-70 factor, ECF subfamily